MKYNKYGKGWFYESNRHRLARLGVKTGCQVNYMFDLETIKQMNREQGRKAKGKTPLIYSGNPEDLKRIPNFGDYRPKGWNLGEIYFVDNSGLGQPGESALTFGEFAGKVKKGKGYAIIEAGQFQVKIGEFEKINYALNLINIKKYKFGSTEWQDANLSNIKEKLINKEEISSQEKIFLQTQLLHMKNRLKGTDLTQRDRVLLEMDVRNYKKILSMTKVKEINYMMGASYPTKKALKESVGKPLRYIETSMFGPEYKPNGTFAVVGPDPYRSRKWYASVTMKDGIIQKVK